MLFPFQYARPLKKKESLMTTQLCLHSPIGRGNGIAELGNELDREASVGKCI